MGIRSVFLGAVAAFGIGQAAEAGTYHFGLTYEDTVFSGATIFDRHGKAQKPEVTIRASEDRLGLPLIHPSLRPGKEYELRLDHDDTGLKSCQLGPINCTVPADGYWSGVELEPIFIHDELSYVKFDSMQLGARVDVFDVEAYPGFMVQGDGWSAWIKNRNAYFTVTSLAAAPVPLPAVPLPAGALLLPVGLAGLALIRRRQQA